MAMQRKGETKNLSPDYGVHDTFHENENKSIIHITQQGARGGDGPPTTL